MSDLGEAYIRVRSDTAGLEEEMKAGVKKAADGTEASDFDGLVKAADDAGTRAGMAGGDSFGKSFIRDANGRLHDEKGNFVNEFGAIGKAAGDEMSKKFDEENENGIKKSINRLGGLLAPDWIKTIAVWVGAIGPGAAELVAALVPAAGLLAEIVPIAIGGAASLAILKIAFSGVGKAIKDINGPTATFQKDLKNLTPSQKEFVQQVKDAQPELKKFKTALSDAFFAGLGSSVAGLAGVLPKIEGSVRELAGELGEAGAALATFLSKNSTAKALSDIILHFSDAIGFIADALPAIGKAFLQIGVTAAPYVTTIAKGFDKISQDFADFISNSTKTGAFNTFLNNAQTAFGQIVGLGKAAYTIISSILTAASQSGGGGSLLATFQTIASVIQQLGKNGGLGAIFSTYNQIFKTLGAVLAPLLPPLGALLKALGTDFSGDLKQLTPGLVNLVKNGIDPLLQDVIALLPVINPVVQAVIKLLDAFAAHPEAVKIAVDTLIAYFVAVKAEGLVTIIAEVATGTKSLAAALGLVDVAADANPIGLFVIAIGLMVAEIVFMVYAFKKIVATLGGWTAIWHDITRTLSSIFEATKTFLIGIGMDIVHFFTNTIPSAFDIVVAWIQTLPGKIKTALLTLLHDAEFALGETIGVILAGILLLPHYIEVAVKSMAAKFVDGFAEISRDSVNGIKSIVKHLEAFPGQAYDAVKAFIPKLASVLTNAWNGAYSKTKSGISRLIGIVKNAPSEIAGLAKGFLSAGEKLISAFFSGMGHTAGIGAIAGDIVGKITAGLNSAISRIDAGINSIAHKVHISLPNIPHLASGAFVTSPTVALIGERNPEVVIPTDNPYRAMQLLNQSGLAAALNMGAPNVLVNVQIGQQSINDLVDSRVTLADNATAKQVTYGTRG
jgi:hypothetical protein